MRMNLKKNPISYIISNKITSIKKMRTKFVDKKVKR
jgi:hypothetical protein